MKPYTENGLTGLDEWLGDQESGRATVPPTDEPVPFH